MRSTLKNVSLVILLLKMCIILSQEVKPKKRIVIDPGHGGKDSGAIGVNDIQEKDVVLNIAKEIVRLNRTLFKNEFEVYLTRYRDTLISLSDRTKLAKQLNADIFISLHCNHADNPEARGIELYVGEIESEYSHKSIWFAYQFQNRIKKQLGFKSRGVKFANFLVLKETINNCPSVLLELGFLSNEDESKYLSKNKSIKILAHLLYSSLK